MGGAFWGSIRRQMADGPYRVCGAEFEAAIVWYYLGPMVRWAGMWRYKNIPDLLSTSELAALSLVDGARC